MLLSPDHRSNDQRQAIAWRLKLLFLRGDGAWLYGLVRLVVRTLFISAANLRKHRRTADPALANDFILLMAGSILIAPAQEDQACCWRTAMADRSIVNGGWVA